MGQPFILNACAKVSANWFPERERLTVTALCGYSFILGVSMGLFMPSLFVEQEASFEVQKSQIQFLGLFTAIMSTVIMIPILFTFKSRPENIIPPQQTVSQSQWKEFKIMVSGKSFMLAVFAATMPNVYFAAFTTVLEQMIRVYDFTSQ